MKKDEIRKEINREIRKMADFKQMLKGTINKVVKRGKEGNKKRVIHQLTYKGPKNVTKTIYIRKAKLAEAKEMTENYRMAKECLETIGKLNEELFRMK